MIEFQFQKTTFCVFFFRKNFIIFTVLLGLASAGEENRHGRGHHGGFGGYGGYGGYGFQGGRNCTIVDSTVTSCVGATGTSCSNSASILVCDLKVNSIL